MKTLFVVTLLGFSLLLQDLPASQEQKQEPQTISTELKEVVAELRVGDKKFADVRGKAVFTPFAGNVDDTLAGTLIFNISEAQRKQIAKIIKTPLTDIPSSIKKDGVIAGFERGAKCPDLRFEVFFRHENFDVSKAEVPLGEGKLQFQPLVLSFKESKQELSQLLCHWARSIQSGRGTARGYVRIFKKLVTGESSNK